MSKLTEKFPFDFAPQGGTVHDLGESYTKETKRIYDLLNDIRENNEGTTEPQPKQLMITENGKIYIRSIDNMKWVYMGEVKENFGLHELGFLKKEDIGLGENGNILDIDIKGNCGKIGGYPIITTNFQDGEVLVYRPSFGGIVNETKASGVGAKELAFLVNDLLVFQYSGVATRNLRLLATTEEEPTSDGITSKAMVWLKPV